MGTSVEKYLALDRGLFLNPQYLIGEPGVWEANPDFLAISFPENMVWMVEVTKTPGAKLFGKVSSFEQDYSWRIREQLVRHKIIREVGGSNHWTIGLWIFAPSVDLSKLEDKATQAGLLNYKARLWKTRSSLRGISVSDSIRRGKHQLLLGGTARAQLW